MKNFGRSLPAKATAVVLSMLLAGLCLALGAAAFYMYEQRYYEADVQVFTDTPQYGWITQTYARNAYEWFLAGANPNQQDIGLGLGQTNFAYEIVQTFEPETVLAYNYHSGKTVPDAEYTYGFHTVRCYVKDPLAVVDNYYSGQAAFTALYPYRFTALFWLGIALVTLCALVIYLLCAAGRRSGEEAVVLNLQDRVPLDLYLTAAAIAVLALLILPLDYLAMASVVEVGAFLVCLLGGFGICLATLLTLTTRLKAGKWWRNTILFRLLALLRRGERLLLRYGMVLFHNIPVIWKLLLAYAAIQTANLCLAVIVFNTWYQEVGVVGGLLLNLVVMAGLGYLALALQRLKKGGQRLAAGELDVKVNTQHLYLDLLEHAENLNSIGDGMALALNQRMRSERLKTELITNVSHDIKTPLTSIINYVDLLQKETIPGRAGEYVEVLDRQSQRLKKLTDDLVEASKASTGNLTVTVEPIGLCELVRQSVGEYAERFADSALDAVVSTPEDEVRVLADGKYLWRVLDNLLGNVCKYGQPGTRVYIDVVRRDASAAVLVKNISRERLNIDSEELMERFVRGDAARTTEGSGLGLNIARSLVELQHGVFRLSIDGDLFKAEIELPCE